MYLAFGLALFFTLLWINTMFAEHIDAKVNPYQKTAQDRKIDQQRAVVKVISIILMSVFWSLTLYLWV